MHNEESQDGPLMPPMPDEFPMEFPLAVQGAAPPTADSGSDPGTSALSASLAASVPPVKRSALVGESSSDEEIERSGSGSRSALPKASPKAQGGLGSRPNSLSFLGGRPGAI